MLLHFEVHSSILNMNTDFNKNYVFIYSSLHGLSSLLFLNFSCFLTFLLGISHFIIEEYNTAVLKKKGNQTKKTFVMWTLLGLPGKEKREKAKKQEIRRVHNSNPLQRHEHVQPSGLLLIMILESKYQLGKNEPRITEFTIIHHPHIQHLHVCSTL